MSRPIPEGIALRHARGCATKRNARCSCTPAYQVRVDVPGPDGVRARKAKTCATLTEAKAWRSDALGEVRAGKLRAASPITVRAAAKEFVDGARDGTIRNRSGDVYKPSSVVGIEDSFRARIVPAIGARRLADVKRADLQRLVNHWAVDLNPSTVRNTVNALRALYRHAISLDVVQASPTVGLALPAVRGGRDRIAPPAEAAALLSTMSDRDRAFWGVAMYAGLRRGELLALRWRDVDLATGIIAVRRSYDPKAKVFGPPKSAAGTRDVPLARTLRTLIVAHKLASPDASPDLLVFPGRSGNPLAPGTITNRARKAWDAENARRSSAAKLIGSPPNMLSPIGLHECRHTFASLMIAAEVNLKQLSTWMGHSTIVITLDRYGHLMPGAEAEGAAKLDRYLDAAGG